MTMRRVIRGGAAAIGAGVAAVLLSVAPAYAHYNTINITGGFASINSGHTAMSACKTSSTWAYVQAEISRNGVKWELEDHTNNGSCTTKQLLLGDYDDWRLCGFTASGAGSCSSWRSV